MIKVTFLNNEEIIITRDTYLLAWQADANRASEVKYYDFSGFAHLGISLNSFGESNHLLALQTIFMNADWFCLKSNTTKIYKTTAIVSLELLRSQVFQCI